MSKVIKLKKGLDIKLKGVAERRILDMSTAARYGIAPSDFPGLTPKLLVQPGETVEAGSPLFFDKKRPEILITSPVSGTVLAVNRGEKRAILNIEIEADKNQRYKQFDMPMSLDREAVIELLLSAGLWPCIIQRPYGIVANPQDMPKAIFVSGFDSAPLAPDMNFALANRYADLNKGFDVLRKLTVGKVYLGLSVKSEGMLNALNGIDIHYFDGPHPAGNVGVQISRTDPINKDDIVWTADIQNVAMIGRFFSTGQVDMTKMYAVAGSEVGRSGYIQAVVGASVADIARVAECRPTHVGDKLRYISGDVLSGTNVGNEGYMGFYTNMLTVIPEGDKYEMLGWAMPRLDKFSVSRTYLSWLQPGRKYIVDTNLHGGHRPFIVTGLFERYVPMDIYPMYLLKAIIAQDIDKMEALGIYEIVPEDLALCEFVDPSKNDIQQIVRDGINLMIKELN